MRPTIQCPPSAIRRPRRVGGSMLRLDNSAPAIGNGPCCGQHVQLSQPGSESVLNAHASGTGKERPGFLYGVCTSAAVRPSAREWLQSLKLERRGRLHTGRWVRTLSHIVPLAAVLMDTRCLRWSQHMQTGWNPTAHHHIDSIKVGARLASPHCHRQCGRQIGPRLDP